MTIWSIVSPLVCRWRALFIFGALLLGTFAPVGSVLAQNEEQPEKQIVLKKACSYNFTDLPENDVMASGQVGSLHEFVCRWAVVRDQLVHRKMLNLYINPLDSLRVDENTRSYLFEMEASNSGDKINWYDEIYVLVASENGVYYDRLPDEKHEDGDPWHLRSFRTVDVPEAKRKYLWTEFYEAYPKEQEDTTQAYWTGRVHTFSLSDSPSLQPIDKYVSVRSPCAEEAGPNASIPIRHMKIVDGQTVEASQIDVRFPRSGKAVVTPRTDSLSEILGSWVGEYALHSSLASDPMSAVEETISDTSGCETDSE